MVSRHHLEQERMEGLCCLSILGEISAEEKVILDKHLEQCEECRKLRNDLEQIVLFDLSSAAAGRVESQVVGDLDPEDEGRLFAQIVRRMQAIPEDSSRTAVRFVPACPMPFWTRVRQSLRALCPIGGWAMAGLLLAMWVQARGTASGPSTSRAVSTAALARTNTDLQTEVDQWKSQTAAAELRSAEARKHLDEDRARDDADKLALTRSTKEWRRLQTEKSALEDQVAQMKDVLARQTSGLAATQASLARSLLEEQATENQLRLVNSRLDQQTAEVANFEKVAESTAVHMPAAHTDLREADARELFGARDLHIVDVYDVDHAGKASQIYGRVYYVNHSLLLFYAFDLNLSERHRKPVAFQAWGYRQPNSKTAQSLGLFYMDDPKLDQWVLRVSDPHILARIDTLFVTIEPPGGSQTPRGRRLLMASLTGPPNHP